MGLTIREIAARAGVSAATVSRVVNGTGAVAPEKREQVLAVLSEQQAAPRRRRSASAAGKTLGVLMLPGSESDPRVIVNKLSAITEKLPRKWSLQLLSSEILPLELEARHLRGELAGLIIAGHGGCAPELGRVFARIPHVWLNSHRLADEGQTVLMGNEFAGRLAARYLIERGCRRPAVLDVASVNPGFPARVDGFRFEFFAQERECGRIAVTLPGGTAGFETAPAEVLEAALNGADYSGCDGLFSPEERLTALFYRVLTRRGGGVTIPVVSCNHTPEYLAGLYPRPASIDLGNRMLAELALDELLRRISGAPGRADHVAVIATPQLMPGER